MFKGDYGAPGAHMQLRPSSVHVLMEDATHTNDVSAVYFLLKGSGWSLADHARFAADCCGMENRQRIRYTGDARCPAVWLHAFGNPRAGQCSPPGRHCHNPISIAWACKHACEEDPDTVGLAFTDAYGCEILL